MTLAASVPDVFTRQKIERMAALALANGIRLHRDAIALYEMGSFPSALQLAILGQEEIAKAFLLEDIHWHMDIDGTPASDFASHIHEILTTHGLKQMHFKVLVMDFDRHLGRRYSRLLVSLLSERTEARKQGATYVGLPRNGRRLRLDGRIINPMATRAKAAHEQISRVNNLLIGLSDGIEDGSIGLDTEESEELLVGLGARLRREWPQTHPQGVTAPRP